MPETPKPVKAKPDYTKIADAIRAINEALKDLTDADAIRALDSAKAARK